MPKIKVSDEIAKRVKKARIEKGLSQYKLALNAGVNLNYIGMIERGEREPSISILEKVCKALDTDLEELFRGL